MDPFTEKRLRQAVKSLDPANDGHWEEDGKPSATAVLAHWGTFGTLADAQAVIDAMHITRDKPYSPYPED